MESPDLKTLCQEDFILTVDPTKITETVTASASTIGSEVKTLRKALRLTSEQFSKLIGCSRMTLSTWESGKRVSRTLELLLHIMLEFANTNNSDVLNILSKKTGVEIKSSQLAAVAFVYELLDGSSRPRILVPRLLAYVPDLRLCHPCKHEVGGECDAGSVNFMNKETAIQCSNFKADNEWGLTLEDMIKKIFGPRPT